MTPEPGAPFTPSAEEIRRLGYRVVDLITAHLAGLPERPVFQPVPPDAVASFRAAPPPQAGEPLDAVLDAFAREIEPYPFGNGHPGFYGWVNSPPALAGVLGAALAAAMNPSVAGGNHAAVHLEHQVVRWFREIVGFPEEARGLLVSGTSAAAIVALAVARHVACARQGWDVRAAGVQGSPGAPAPHLVAYIGGEGHGCHQKAVELLGIGSANLRRVPVDGAMRMLPWALDALLAEDLAAGRVPVAVIASAGTVNTGAIDPLEEIADLCARHGVWLHVDGAYGGPSILLEEYEPRLRALARADSLSLDPHKWLYVPVDAGLVLVRNGEAMRDALSHVPPYLRMEGDEGEVQGPPWFSEFGLEQTRPFRALKVWMALRHFGMEGYRRLIGHDVALARYLAEAVRASPELVLHEPQELSIVCFRAAPPEQEGDEAALDALNRAVLLRVQLGGQAFLSGTVMEGRFWLRACIVNPRAGRADIDRMLAAITEAVRREGERAAARP